MFQWLSRLGWCDQWIRWFHWINPQTEQEKKTLNRISMSMESIHASLNHKGSWNRSLLSSLKKMSNDNNNKYQRKVSLFQLHYRNEPIFMQFTSNLFHEEGSFHLIKYSSEVEHAIPEYFDLYVHLYTEKKRAKGTRTNICLLGNINGFQISFVYLTKCQRQKKMAHLFSH